MVAPSTTYNAAGHALSSGSLAASGTTSFDIDASTDFELRVSNQNTGGGTVAATNGLQVDVVMAGDTGINYDTISAVTIVIPTVVSTLAQQTIPNLGPGKWRVKFKNLDVTNAITRAAADIYVPSVA